METVQDRYTRVGHGLDSSMDWIGLGHIIRIFNVILILIADLSEKNDCIFSIARLSVCPDFKTFIYVNCCIANLAAVVIVIYVSDFMRQLKMLNRFLYASEIVFAAGGSMDWIGCGSENGHTSWIGLDWV